MTVLADTIAARVRRWYELNRETWWDRVGVDEGQRATADAFMLNMIAEVHKATAELTPPEPKPMLGVSEPVLASSGQVTLRGRHPAKRPAKRKPPPRV